MSSERPAIAGAGSVVIGEALILVRRKRQDVTVSQRLCPFGPPGPPLPTGVWHCRVNVKPSGRNYAHRSPTPRSSHERCTASHGGCVLGTVVLHAAPSACRGDSPRSDESENADLPFEDRGRAQHLCSPAPA